MIGGRCANHNYNYIIRPADQSHGIKLSASHEQPLRLYICGATKRNRIAKTRLGPFEAYRHL